jgi:hypothetical protein
LPYRQTYLRPRNRDMRKRMARLGLDLTGWISKPGRCLGTERQKTICINCSLGTVEDEDHIIFVCPLYAPLRLKHTELFADAPNLSSVCQSGLAARFNMIANSGMQSLWLRFRFGTCLSPLSHPWLPLDGNQFIH